MKEKFKNPIAPRNEKPSNKMTEKNTAFTFSQIPYDQRSGCFIKAGTDYGVGFNQPIAKESNKKESCIPQKAFKWKPYE